MKTKGKRLSLYLVKETLGMFRKGRESLKMIGYVKERSGVFWKGQVCFGKVTYV
jgi:hypothetical protein